MNDEYVPSRCVVCDIIIYRGRDEAAGPGEAYLSRQYGAAAAGACGHARFVPHQNGRVKDRCVVCAGQWRVLTADLERFYNDVYGGCFSVEPGPRARPKSYNKRKEVMPEAQR